MTEPDFAMGTSLVAGTARGLAPLPAFLLGAEAVPLLWVDDGKVASPSLEGGQVAVLRLHAASTGHVTKPAYSCVRGMYVRCGTKVVRVPRKRRTSENAQNANFAFTEFYEGGKAPVHYLQALASEGSQKGTFPIGSANALTHRLTICLGQNDSHAKESRAVLISRSLCSRAAPP